MYPSTPDSGRAASIADFLADQLGRGEFITGARLPAIRALATDLEASTQTIQRALRILLRRRLIYRSPVGRGYRAGLEPVLREPGTIQPSLTRVEEVEKRLVAEIVAGRHVPGSLLPSIKELARRERCSFPVLRQALRSMEHKGFLRRTGLRYEIPIRKRTTKTRSHFHLVGRDGLLERFGSHGMLLLRGIQQSLQARDAGPLQLLFAREPKNAAPALKPHLCAGFIYPRLNPDKQWLHFLRGSRSVPSVIIDLAESDILEDEKKERAWFYVRADNVAAGAEIGRHLYSLGHRKIAALSYLNPASPWISARIRGLSEVFGETVTANSGVVVATPEQWERIDHLDRIMEATHRYLGGLREKLPDSSKHMQAAQDLINRWIAYSHVRARMDNLYEWLLGDSSVTAWVAMNDDWAIPALDCLRERNVEVPERLSVAAFDNGMASYGALLTSYDFNLDAFGHAAVRCLLEPGRSGADGRGVLTVAGHLVQRRTTGPARSSAF